MTKLLGKKLSGSPQSVPISAVRLPVIVGTGFMFLALVSAALVFNSIPGIPRIAAASKTPAIRTLADFGTPSVPGIDASDVRGSVLGASTDVQLCAFTDSKGNPTDLKKEFNTSDIFPILPLSVLTGKDAKGHETNCSPPYWNIDVFRVLLYKGFGLLNYVIEVTAIVMTIYAGILYLSGFANEKNVATAKTVLIATYTGLALSLSATLILKTTIGVFSDKKTSDVIQQNEQKIFDGK